MKQITTVKYKAATLGLSDAYSTHQVKFDSVKEAENFQWALKKMGIDSIMYNEDVYESAEEYLNRRIEEDDEEQY